MGCVYEVVADGDTTHLALKAFTLDHGNRDFLRRRFLAEAKILSRLNHPRLVHVHESGVDEQSGTPYYVMDLVRSATGESETLEDVRRAGEVTEAQVLQWFADIREGLEYIHAQGVVHRDVKLENVLIDKDGHAVLSDFGVSRIFDDRLRNELMVTTTFIAGETTGTQPVMGTYWYLAPEIRKGDAATPESDWYSLGVLMYRLLTGMWYEPNTKAFDLLAPFSKACQRIVRQLLSDDAWARHPRPKDCPAHGVVASRPRVVRAFLGVAAIAFLGFLVWLCFSNASVSSPSPSPSSSPFSLHYCKGIDFVFRPCPAGTNALMETRIAVTKPYWLAEVPVTRRQWFGVRGEPAVAWKGGEDAPMTYVSRDEICAWCSNVNVRFAKTLPEGYEIRLPTVAEWRLAYQVGRTETHDLSVRKDVRRRANFAIGWFGQGVNGTQQTSNMKRYYADRKLPVPLVKDVWPEFPPRQIDSNDAWWVRDSSQFASVPVGLKAANGLGLHDMHGNCFEMTYDSGTTNVRQWGGSEFGLRVGNPYVGFGPCVTNPVVRSGSHALMLGTCISPELRGEDVWVTPFDRLPHLGFRLCIGPKLSRL